MSELTIREDNLMPDFRTALTTFLAGLDRIEREYRKKHDFGLPSTFSVEEGPRYIRVVKNDVEGRRRSAHCFIDKQNGEVLKNGGWKAPAKTKQSRGNIFDTHNGLGSMTPYGPAYLNR